MDVAGFVINATAALALAAVVLAGLFRVARAGPGEQAEVRRAVARRNARADAVPEDRC